MSRADRRTLTSKGAARHNSTSQIPVNLLRRILGVLLLTALVNQGLSNQMPRQAPTEYQVKAAFLYNFTKFIEWPAKAFNAESSTFVIGVIGKDPFGSNIDQTLGGKTVNGRPLAIRRLKHGEDPRACHILFIASSEQKYLGRILERLKGTNVLTVGEMDKFSQQGGSINLIMEDGQVRFEINKAVVEQAELKVSSKLLALAKAIFG